jgi:hypothetical protein
MAVPVPVLPVSATVLAVPVAASVDVGAAITPFVSHERETSY